MIRRTLFWLGGLAALGLTLTMPSWGSPQLVRITTDFYKLAVMACAWNLIGGLTGYSSFGNVVFFGLGGYATGVVMVQLHWPFALGLLASLVVCVLFAILLGMPILRLKGHYFAIATLGAAEATREIVRNLDFAGANQGLVLPLINAPLLFYFSSLGLLLLILIGTALLIRSRLGYGLVAIREDEEAAAAAGINTQWYKVIAFALSGLFTGLVGGIAAYQSSFVDPDSSFTILRTLQMIVMTVIGGAGTVLGPVVGALIIFTSSEYLATLSATLRSLPVIFFGLIIIGATLFLPGGLMELLSGRVRLRLGYFLENIRKYRV